MSSFLPLLDHLAIVMVHPKYPENIGSAARIALNMGVSRLIVVSEKPPDPARMLPCATHNAKEIIESIEYRSDLPSALADYAFVLGTTARVGKKRQVAASPRQVFRQVLPLLKENRVAILFGPENRGLTNDEVKLCSALTTIPTANFSSINLAQAVAVICYELYYGLAMAEGEEVPPFAPRLATLEEQEGMYREVEGVVERLDALEGKTQPVNRSVTVRNFLGRMSLQARETRLIAGICRQLLQVLAKEKR